MSKLNRPSLNPPKNAVADVKSATAKPSLNPPKSAVADVKIEMVKPSLSTQNNFKELETVAKQNFYNPVFVQKGKTNSPVSQLNTPDVSKMPRFSTGLSESPVHSTTVEELDKVVSDTNEKITSAFSAWTTPEKISDTRLAVEETYSDIANYINTNEKELRSTGQMKNAVELLMSYNDMLGQLDDLDRTYKKYSSEDEYNAAIRSNEELYTVNLSDLDTEIKDLEKRVAAYQPLYNKLYQNKGLSETEQAEALSIIGEYSSYPELEKALGEKKAYYNRAAYKQEGARLGDVGKENSSSYDPEYFAYVEKGNNIPFESVGKIKIASIGQYGGAGKVEGDDVYLSALALAEHNGANIENEYNKLDNASQERLELFRDLSDEEFNTLAYHIARDKENGTNNTERYLFTIEENIHGRRAEKIAKKLEGKPLQSILYAGKAGVNQFGTNVKNLVEQKEGYIPLNTTQQASGMVRENLQDVTLPMWYNFKTGKFEDKVFGASLGQLTYDAVSTTANMLPSILTAKISNVLLPGSGAAVGAALIGASSAGNAYQEMINLGYSKGQANAYALMTGASEALLERAIGGFSDLGGMSKKLATFTKGIDNATARLAVQLGGSMAGEFLEEATQEAISPFLQNWALTYSKNDWDDVKWGEVIYSGILGALSSLGHEAIPRTVSAVAEMRAGNILNTVKYDFGITQETINDYVERAYAKKNTEDYKKYAFVSERLANDISNEVADIREYSHALRDNDIRHIKNSHGEETAEKYPVTKEDQKKIPWIVQNYDKVLVLKRNDGRQGIIYVKASPDGIVYYLEQVTTKYGNEPLLVNKQMIKTGIDDIPDLPGLREEITKKQSETEFLNDLKKAPQVYAQDVYQSHSNTSLDGVQPVEFDSSHDVSSDVSDTIVSQSEAEVNTFTPRPNPTPNSELVVMAPRAFEKGPVLPTAEEIMRERRAGKAETELEASAIRLGVSEEITKEALEISQGLQRNIKFVHSDDVGDEGWYDEDTDTICVNVNAKTFGTGFVGTVVHEVTHSIENAPGYSKLYQGVMAQLQRNQAHLKSEQDKWITRYQSRGETITPEEANREIVADYVRQKLFTDKKSIEDVAQKNHNFAIWIYEKIEKLTAALGLNSAREKAFLNRARHLWLQAIENANRQSRIDENFKVSDVFDNDLDTLTEDAEQHSYNANYNNIHHSYTDEFEGTTEESISPVIDSSPKAVKNFISGAENSTERRIKYILPVPYSMLDEVMSKPLRTISEELMATGDVSRPTIEKAFETIYERSLRVSREYAERYSSVNKDVSEMTIKLSDREYEVYRGKISKLERLLPNNTVKFTRDKGITLDDAWNKLNSIAPELFPKSTVKIEPRVSKILSHVIDYSFASNYVKNPTEQTKRWKLDDFAAAVSDMVVKERTQALRYTKSNESQTSRTDKLNLKGDWIDNTEPIPTPTTPKEVSELYKSRREASRRRTAAYKKFLFTKSDQIQILRILRGDITIEDLNPERDNVDGISAVVPIERECERYAKAIEKYRNAYRKSLDDVADSVLPFIGSKDKTLGIGYTVQTASRNFKYLVPDADGVNKEFADNLVDTYISGISRAEAQKNRYTEDLIKRVKSLGLSRKVEKGNTDSEAAIVQMYGEARDNLSYLANRKIEGEKREGLTAQEWEKYIEELFANNPNADRAKIENSVKVFREIYDELFKKLNEALVRNGYEPVDYRYGYFPHFKADENNILNYFASKLGFEAGLELPTTINGLTQNFRPGKSWFGNIQSRHGTETAYDALEGFEKYLNGASNVIFQTDNIQKLRSLARRIRYHASDEGVKLKIEEIERDETKTQDQKDEEIKALASDAKYGLSNFVVWLDEYTNLLANKKSKYDRLFEGEFGRKGIYGALKKAYQNTGANMVVANLASALTNFVPIVDSYAVTGTLNTTRATLETLRNLFSNDGLMSMSDFYTNRTANNKLVMNWLEKTADKAGFAMNVVDSFVAQVIIRSRYYQNLKDGMSESLALREADAFAERIMAGRSKGEMPNIFHAQSLKIMTQFQLEVANQYNVFFDDMPSEIRKRGAIYGAGLVFRLIIGTALLNGLFERLIGRRIKLDPLDILNEFIGKVSGKKLADPVDEFFDLLWEGDPFEIIKDVEKESAWTALTSTGKDVVKEIPFIGSLFGGGRLPVANAWPGFFSEFGTFAGSMASEDLTAGQKAEKAAEFVVPKLAMTLLPFGYNQLSKMYKGAKAITEGGKFKTNNSGEEILQYPYFSDEGASSIVNAFKAIMFGASSISEAREWVEQGFPSFTAKETEGYLEAVATGEGQRKIFETIMSLKTLEPETPESTIKKADKLKVLSDADLSSAAKYAIYKSVLATTDELEQIQEMYDNGASENAVTKYVLNFISAKRTPNGKGGYKPLTDVERWELALNSAKGDKDRLAVLKTISNESQYTNFEILSEYKIPLDTLVILKAKLPEYDKDENGSYSSEEVKKAIDSVFSTVGVKLSSSSLKTSQLTREDKAVLWQLATGSKNPYANPYGNYQTSKRIVERKKTKNNSKK